MNCSRTHQFDVPVGTTVGSAIADSAPRLMVEYTRYRIMEPGGMLLTWSSSKFVSLPEVSQVLSAFFLAPHVTSAYEASWHEWTGFFGD